MEVSRYQHGHAFSRPAKVIGKIIGFMNRIHQAIALLAILDVENGAQGLAGDEPKHVIMAKDQVDLIFTAVISNGPSDALTKHGLVGTGFHCREISQFLEPATAHETLCGGIGYGLACFLAIDQAEILHVINQVGSKLPVIGMFQPGRTVQNMIAQTFKNRIVRCYAPRQAGTLFGDVPVSPGSLKPGAPALQQVFNGRCHQGLSSAPNYNRFQAQAANFSS